MFIELQILPYAIYSFYSKMIFSDVVPFCPLPYPWWNSLLPRGLKHTWLWGSHQFCINRTVKYCKLENRKLVSSCFPSTQYSQKYSINQFWYNIWAAPWDRLLDLSDKGTWPVHFNQSASSSFLSLYIEKWVRCEIGNCLTFYNELKKKMFGWDVAISKVSWHFD